MNTENKQPITAGPKPFKTTVTFQGGDPSNPLWGPKWVIKNPANKEEEMRFESPYYLATELFRLKAEVERLRKAGGWQPMQTAPFDPNIRIIICTFDDDVEITYSSDLCHYPEREYPKYWMPVPNAAKEGKQP